MLCTDTNARNFAGTKVPNDYCGPASEKDSGDLKNKTCSGDRTILCSTDEDCPGKTKPCDDGLGGRTCT